MAVAAVGRFVKQHAFATTTLVAGVTGANLAFAAGADQRLGPVPYSAPLVPGALHGAAILGALVAVFGKGAVSNAGAGLLVGSLGAGVFANTLGPGGVLNR